MPAHHEIRAQFDRDSIVIYQAYSPRIAEPALREGRFVPPFSLRRMTWIKPSFLWLMARSNWGLKKGQEYILGIRLPRSLWEFFLCEGVLTSPEAGVYAGYDDWEAQFAAANVHIQWDPEYSIRGSKLNIRSIQVGVSRHVIDQYVDGAMEIVDYTPLVRKIHKQLRNGQGARARKLLPRERPYPIPEGMAARLAM